jgi:hypothetical protein
MARKPDPPKPRTFVRVCKVCGDPFDSTRDDRDTCYDCRPFKRSPNQLKQDKEDTDA